MLTGDFSRSVFVNCPFSPDYREFLRAILFVTLRLGFEPRIASDESDSGDQRIDKIKRLIRECRHGIHDLSLNVAAKKGDPARMNMPYELGIDLGARWYGPSPLERKITLILEKERGSVKQALTDLAGVDLRTYGGSIDILIREIRAHFYAFLNREQKRAPEDFPTHDGLWDDWTSFLPWLQRRPDGTLRSPRELEDMETSEFRDKIREWLAAKYPDLKPLDLPRIHDAKSIVLDHPKDSSVPSPAHDLIREWISDAFDSAIREGITPWSFLRSSKGVNLQLPNGRRIAYSGIEFEGTPREIFWKVVPEAYIKDLTRSCFEWTRELCDSRKLSPVAPLCETAIFLHGGLGRLLGKMADIDRKLRGKGFSKSVLRYEPETERRALGKIIEARLKAELKLVGRPS